LPPLLQAEPLSLISWGGGARQVEPGRREDRRVSRWRPSRSRNAVELVTILKVEPGGKRRADGVVDQGVRRIGQEAAGRS